MTPISLTDTPTLKVRAYPDPVVEAHGYWPEDPYIERVVLPWVGPSAMLMWRRLATLVKGTDEVLDIDVSQLFKELGLSDTRYAKSAGPRTLSRLHGFNLIIASTGRIAVRRAIAPITGRRLAQLPVSVQTWCASAHKARATR